MAGGMLITILSLGANPPQVLSVRDASIAMPAGGDSDSVIPSISADGRYVAFSSSANNLVTNDDGQFGLDVFLYDRMANVTVLASVNTNGTGGGNRHSVCGQVSTNGQYVVFQSDASNLLPGDTNGACNIFMRDMLAGTNLLISVATNGGWGSGDSTDPVMTPDGRWVAFISSATNLVSGDINGIADLFVRDTVNGTTRMVTAGAVPAAGANVVATPAITPNGGFVAFFSTVNGLAAGVPTTTAGEIYSADLVSNTMAWVSTNAATVVSSLFHLNNMPSVHPVISADGRYVAFKSGWTNGFAYPGGTGIPATIVFCYDASNQTTTIIGTNGYPPWTGSDDVFGPEMTPDGRFIAFAQLQVTGGKTNSVVCLWDRQTGTNMLVSAGLDGLWPTNSSSYAPALSADGRYVIFLSDATNMVANLVTTGPHLYRRDMQMATTLLLDTDTNGVATGDMTGEQPSLSADGSCVVYASPDGGLVPNDVNNAFDVFLWNSVAGTNAMISARNSQAIFTSGNRLSTVGPFSISGNGTAVAFASFASDLVTNDFNQDCDVFVRNLTAGSNILVSVGLDGNSALGGLSYNPILSADGRYVVFISSATNLVINDTNGASDIFRRDLQTGMTVLVSVDSSGMPLHPNGASMPVCSQDGRYVAFLSLSNNNLIAKVFWRDISASVAYLVSSSTSPFQPISMSADGQRVAYFNNSSQLYVWDANLLGNIYTNAAAITSTAISPAGNRLLYLAQNQLFVADLTSGTNTLLFPSAVPLSGTSQWSGDGRYVAFVTATNLLPGDANGTNDVYLVDLETGTLTLLSLNQAGTGSAAGPSDSPVISADGRVIVYRTFALDACPGIIRAPSLIFFDRFTGIRSLLTSGTMGTALLPWVSAPLLTTNGLNVAFQSWDSGLVTSDLNRVGDIFSVVSMLDSDGDGIPDWWMIQYFGHPTGEAQDLSRAQDDADGDGASNLQEYIAGTNPTNRNSVLTIRVAAGIPDGNTQLEWPAAAGRIYQMQFTTDLANPNWQLCPAGVEVVGNTGYYSLHTTNTQQFFRIACRLQ